MIVATPPAAQWPAYYAAEQALRQLERALEATPGDVRLLFERGCLLDRLGRDEAARQACLDVLAHDFGHAGALGKLGHLLARTGYTSAALTVFGRAVEAHPDDPAARVHLAHLLRRADQPAAARQQYDATLALDPTYAPAHQGLAILLDTVDQALATHHRALGFAGRALSTAPYRGAATPVVVLQLVSARGGNLPTRPILDDRLFLTHTLVAEHADPSASLPPHDLVFNAIGDADRCADALAAAERLLRGTTRPVLNPPDRVRPTTRTEIMRRLAGLPGVSAPRTLLLPRQAFVNGPPDGLVPPFLLRSPGHHTGQHFLRIDRAQDLHAALAALPGERLLAIEYLDAAGTDGAFRKYRAMLIGRAILPLHLAISADWKVHYFTAGMTDPAHRAEEARFLDDMAGVLGETAMAALAAIAGALALDYAGVDFALAPDGRLLLFEANAAMIIAAPPPDPVWDYRRPAICRAIESVQALILARAGAPGLEPGHDRPSRRRA